MNNIKIIIKKTFLFLLKLYTVSFFTFLFGVNFLFARNNDENYKAFFPLSVGNKWIMVSYLADPPYTIVYSVVDTVHIKNELYHKVDFGGIHYYRENTLGHFFEYKDTSEVMIMDFNMSEGDSLQVCPNRFTYCLGRKKVTTFIGDQGDEIYFLFDYDNRMADDEGEIVVEEGVGPVNHLYSFHYDREYLKGAVIGGVAYGDTTITSVLPQKNNNKEFSLEQNYPNPFNSSTIICFSLPKSDYITLRIFNMLGREFVIVNKKYFSNGEYEIKWDAKNLSNGTYFYQLQTGNFTETKKLNVVK